MKDTSGISIAIPLAGLLLMFAAAPVQQARGASGDEDIVSFESVARDDANTPNNIAIARALDSAVGDPRAAKMIDFLTRESQQESVGLRPEGVLHLGGTNAHVTSTGVTVFDVLEPHDLRKDLALIDPEALTSIFNIRVSQANVETANLERRMDDIRAGSTGFSAPGFSLNDTAPGFDQGLAGPSGAEGKSGKSVTEMVPGPKWGVFLTGLGDFADIGSTSNAKGFNLATGGFNLGGDYRFTPNFAVGVTGGYTHTDVSLSNSGDLYSDSAKFGAYATAFSGGFYGDAGVSGGFDSYGTHRTALHGSANGGTDGGNITTLVATGYDWKKGALTIGPAADFQYTYASFNGFSEHGSLAPLTIHGQAADSIRTSVGMKTTYDWKVAQVHVIPEFKAAWQHEYGQSDYSLVSSFANGAGNSFNVQGPSIGRDTLLISAGVSVQLNERFTLYAYYDGELATDNYEANNVSAGCRLAF